MKHFGFNGIIIQLKPTFFIRLKFIRAKIHSLPKGKNTMLRENKYRTHYCGEIREDDIGKSVRVAGWVENIRDHGGVMFLDIRDHYGVVQVVVHDEKLLENINK